MEPIHLEHFLQTRREEIVNLKEQIDQCDGNKLAFQQLPRYMRRRQMSQDTKRLPKRLREIDVAQKWKSNPEKVSLKALRRYCRRRIKKRYLLRSRKARARWLETHVWHAKRFRMVTKWNFRLAERSYEKTFRKCYRSTDRGCFAHDASYTNCFELSGPRKAIVQPLDLLTDQRSNWLFSDSRYADGSFKGSAIIFEPQRYPFQAIGPISFVWLPKNDDDTDDDETDADKKIVRFWFWTHAAFAQSIRERFCATFVLDRDTLTNPQTKVCLLDFVQKVNVFRLIGPKSLEILKDMLKIPLLGHPDKWFQENVIQRPHQLEKLYRQKDQWKQVMKLTDPSNLANNQVLNLTVVNPRYVSQTLAAEKLVAIEEQKQVMPPPPPPPLPPPSATFDDSQPSVVEADRKRNRYSSRFAKKQKTTASTEIVQCGGFLHRFLRSECGSTAIADLKAKKTKRSARTNPRLLFGPRLVDGARTKPRLVNEARTKLSLIDGETPNVRENAAAAVIPIMLVQRSGNRVRRYRNVGYGSGFDLFVPATWARIFWNCLHLRRACIGGLRAIDSLAFERGVLSPFAPDTIDGRAELQQIGEQLATDHFRRPPKCRPNFRKLNVPVPFQVNWSVLLRDWKKDLGSQKEPLDFYVLRNKVLLEQLNRNLCKIQTATDCNRTHFQVDIPNSDRCLLPVRLRAINNKGTFGRLTMICFPDTSDYGSGERKQSQLFEKRKPDENSRARKQLRLEHRKQRKRLQKLQRREKHRRLNERKSSTGERSDETGLIVIDDNDDAVSQPSISNVYKAKMRALWLNTPDADRETYRYKCCRQIMGFVEIGDYSMRSGFGAAVGYVTANSLLELIADKNRPCATASKKSEVFVWARDRDSLLYRYCAIEIVPFDNNDL